jgi:DNA-directed RNA polymerase subunit RPC12/RpoP
MSNVKKSKVVCPNCGEIVAEGNIEELRRKTYICEKCNQRVEVQGKGRSTMTTTVDEIHPKEHGGR